MQCVQLNPVVQPLLGEKVACVAVSPHWTILSFMQVECYPSLWQLYSDHEDFSNGVLHVIVITTIAESNPVMAILTNNWL